MSIRPTTSAGSSPCDRAGTRERWWRSGTERRPSRRAGGRLIMDAPALAIHAQDYQTRPLAFGLLTYLRMTRGAFVTAADLQQAMRLRRELTRAVNLKLKTYGALTTASALIPAPAFSDIDPNSPPNWPIQTMPFNVTGNPARSIPTGVSASGLPLS